MKKRTILLLILLPLLAGCAASRPAPLPAEPPRPLPTPPPVATAGSLWSERSGDLFGDIKARGVGDIVTVAIYERASASKEANTSTSRNSSSAAGLSRFFGLEENLAAINAGIDPTQLIDTSYQSDFDGSGKTSRQENLVATLTVQVTEMLPNGNLAISGGKNVTVNREEQLIRLSGIIRPADISEHNVVDSKNILDARIAYTGKGVISDKQGQGWLMRILDHVWPF